MATNMLSICLNLYPNVFVNVIGWEFYEKYMGESSGTLGKRLRELLKTPPLYMTTITPQVIPQQLTNKYSKEKGLEPH